MTITSKAMATHDKLAAAAIKEQKKADISKGVADRAWSKVHDHFVKWSDKVLGR
jgi:hypothetical protein